MTREQIRQTLFTAPALADHFDRRSEMFKVKFAEYMRDKDYGYDALSTAYFGFFAGWESRGDVL